MSEPILDDDFAQQPKDPQTVQFAGFWLRLGASLIDSLVLLPLILLDFYNILTIKSFLLMVLITLLSAFYKPWLEGTRSATIGKMVVGIKLVDYNLDNISMKQATDRYFPWIITYILSFITNIFLFTSPEFQGVDEFMEIGMIVEDYPVNQISTLYSFIFIGLVGSLAFDQRRQGVHDKFAETYCIVGK